MFLIIIQIGILGFGNQININAKVDDVKHTNEKNNISSRIENRVNSVNNLDNISNNNLYENNALLNINIDTTLWELKIPKINLKAEIAEGTSKEVLNKYIGHFEETSKESGNVGLAAHNRGYNVNYFERIKELEIGDEIYYTYNGKEKCYIVNLTTIIKNTDWNYLKYTKENKLTLITCVENKPEYRRCIQAIENKERRV